VVDPSRQRKTVHFSGHVDVGKQRVHRKPFQNADGLRGMGRFDDVKSRPTQVGRNLRKATYRFKKEASIPTDAYTHITVRIGSGRTTNASVPSTFQSIASRRPASRGRSALVLFLLRRQDDARTIRVTVRQLASGSHCGCAYGMSPDECRAIEPG
jgi:hypothetical protein